jgi:hypothetical protein
VSFQEVVGVTESFAVTALYEKQRPWQEKWQEVGAAWDAVSEVYSGSVPGGAEQWKAIALTFFRACHELPEAITSDGTVPTLVTRRIQRAAQCRAALRLVADVDNTRKHGGRDPDKCHARVGEISWGDHDTPTMAIIRECPIRTVRSSASTLVMRRRPRWTHGGRSSRGRASFLSEA